MMPSRTITLSSSRLSVQVDPDVGGRITSILDGATGTEWLHPGVDAPPPNATSSFAEGSRGGFDECLPSVQSCAAPGWPQEAVGDHGDFWWRAWEVVLLTQDTIVLEASEPDYPASLLRRLELSPSTPVIRIFYELRSQCSHVLPYLYSAHPLFALSESMSLELLVDQPVCSAFGQRLQPGRWSRWPLVETLEGTERLDVVDPAGPTDNYKVFVRSTGDLTLRRLGTQSALRLRFDPDVLPWVGICVNRRAWPHEGASDCWVAVEPTTAPTDDLSNALESGWSRSLAPGHTHCWSLELELVDDSPHGRKQGD